MAKKLTQARLKELLHYDPETGIFTWILTNSPRATKGSRAGYTDVYGYNIIRIDKKNYKAGRLAWLYVEGYLPENNVSHINQIKNDARWVNLRHTNTSCTNRNSKLRRNNSSGITGITEKNGKWWVQMTTNSKCLNLGCYTDLIAAAKVRWEAEITHGYPRCITTSTAYLYLKKHGEL